jgi:hypothetical protein
VVVGVFTLLNWDSTFLDRRDVVVLAPLPVQMRTLFGAKIAATASSLGIVVAAWNWLAGFAYPLALAPDGSGLGGTIRFMVAFWATLLAAGTFLYCASAVVSVGLASSSDWRFRPVARRRLLSTVAGHGDGSQGTRESTDVGLAAVVLVYGVT